MLNALVANETMVGREEHELSALSQNELCAALERYGRLE